jgi:hypothetical protein
MVHKYRTQFRPPKYSGLFQIEFSASFPLVTIGISCLGSDETIKRTVDKHHHSGDIIEDRCTKSITSADGLSFIFSL